MTALPAGIGLRSRHFAEIDAVAPSGRWFEVHAENYMGGGAALSRLEGVRRDHRLSLHGVGLSLGSADGIDAGHLERLAALAERLEPALVSEHLSWSVNNGFYFNDLIPLPLTPETLAVVSRNVDRMQTRLKRRILIENPSAYLRFKGMQIPEAEFLGELARRTGCGLLCDVNNIVVTTSNLGGDPMAWLDALPAEAVGEIHLAGHSVNRVGEVDIRIDDHGSPVPEPVWRLYERAVRRFPHAPALIEWDTVVPPLATLLEEAQRADRRRTQALAEVPHAAAA